MFLINKKRQPGLNPTLGFHQGLYNMNLHMECWVNFKWAFERWTEKALQKGSMEIHYV